MLLEMSMAIVSALKVGMILIVVTTQARAMIYAPLIQDALKAHFDVRPASQTPIGIMNQDIVFVPLTGEVNSVSFGQEDVTHVALHVLDLTILTAQITVLKIPLMMDSEVDVYVMKIGEVMTVQYGLVRAMKIVMDAMEETLSTIVSCVSRMQKETKTGSVYVRQDGIHPLVLPL